MASSDCLCNHARLDERTVAEGQGGEGQWGLGKAVLNVLSVRSPAVARIRGQAQLHGLSLF